MKIKEKVFLKGAWKNLIIRTYKCNKKILQNYLPDDVEPDLWEGEALLSMVAFQFSDVKFFGCRVPFHQDFGEINFRVYVKSKKNNISGVQFLREYAPKRIVATIANNIFKEPFFYLNVKKEHQQLQRSQKMTYSYSKKGAGGKVQIESELLSRSLEENNLEEFIVDRYIAFVKSSGKKDTNLYKIYHLPWRLFPIRKVEFDQSILDLLPSDIKTGLSQNPVSTYFVDGSDVEIGFNWN
jgi:uncharacterized protein YqjF (DUF2071 family)